MIGGCRCSAPFHWARTILGLLGLSVVFGLSTSLEASNPLFVVSDPNDSGPGSLRQAILDSNATNGPNTIIFQIPSSSGLTITPLSALPPISIPVFIDGRTQSGFSNQPIIEINGVSAGNNAAFRLLAGGTTIRGLVINRFSGTAIDIEGPGNNVIAGNFIGTDLTGSLSRPNGLEGVWINGSSANTIGGTNAGDRNVISGNGDAGVYLLNANSNTIIGNFVGTTASGAAKLPNAN